MFKKSSSVLHVCVLPKQNDLKFLNCTKCTIFVSLPLFNSQRVLTINQTVKIIAIKNLINIKIQHKKTQLLHHIIFSANYL